MSFRLKIVAMLLTVLGLTGCGVMGQLNPKTWNRLNRGENYMNDDGFFSVPVAAEPRPTPSPVTE